VALEVSTLQRGRQSLDLGRQDCRCVEPGAQRFDLAPGTADSRFRPAMNGHQLDLALSAGRHAVERAKLAGVDLIWAEGRGHGAALTNAAWGRWLRSTEPTATLGLNAAFKRDADPRARDELLAPCVSPAAVARCPLSGIGDCTSDCPSDNARDCISDSVRDWAGAILRRHADVLTEPYEALRRIGGFEHAALVGSALAAAQLGLRWVALGESAHVARRLSVRLNPSVAVWLDRARAERVLALQ
jgi:nicotinate-nucleotide--dimethylbenzimidazole phosphoribosyltransferase